jgi:hypothetical protein
LILCLLQALSNPAIESRHAAAKPDLSLALIHNGIYGRLQPGPGSAPGSRGDDALRTQWLRLRALDSSEGVSTRVVPVIADGPGAREVSERFGDYGEAVERLLSGLGSRPGTVQIQLPVFAWTDAARAKGRLLQSLKENPGLQIVLTDFTAAEDKVNAFAGLRATPSQEAPTITLQARLSPAAAEGAAGKVQVSLNGRLFQEVAAQGGRAEVTLPLGEGPRAVGRFSLPKSGFAVEDLHFCFPETGGLLLAHSGSALTSLPSLGRESYYRRIVHVAAAKDIPWSGPSATGKLNPPAGKAGVPQTGAGAKSNGGELRLVYLSGERGSQPEVYARAVEFVKRGGRLIIGVGRDSDIPMLNRFLLQPLRLGRLGNLVETSANAPVSADRQALARLGRLPADPGSLGSVRKRFAFAPDSGTEILLSQGGSDEAVLAARDFHRGQALLWTTDIDDLDWSDLGVNPLTPLLHQALQEATGLSAAGNSAVASDSVYTAVLEPGPGAGDPPGGTSGTAGSAFRAEVRDPEGRPFTKVRMDGNRLRIGPFDKLGIHRIISGKDTSAFAVNLSLQSSLGNGPGGEAPSADAREAAKEDFLKDFKAYHGRLLVAGPGDPVAVQASVRRLWPALFLAAILLLFLEGLISATFSLRRNRP